MRVLLVDTFLGGSHHAWAEGYRSASSHDVEIIGLPARWWRWRMRGGAVTLAERAGELGASGYRPDVVVASSMTDVALLRALLDPVWGRVPTALYLHESQLSYPLSPRQRPDPTFAFVNWTSALAADRLLFNSGFHLDVFFEATDRFLRDFPDHTHVHLLESVRNRSTVLPVGVDLTWLDHTDADRGDPPLVMWNHRWEHDKDPGSFAAALRHLAAEGVAFRVALCGEAPGQEPGDRAEIVARLGERVVHTGHAPVGLYRELLTRSSVVVSTARQEFFGISVVEAVAAGARPVLPDRLAYPWLIPSEFHAEVLYPEEGLVTALREAVAVGPAPVGLPAAMRAFGWDRLAPRYDDELAALADGR